MDQGGSSGGAGDKDLIEDQLLRYARDLKELFFERRNLEDTAAQTKEQAQLRTREVVALNNFIRQRLLELFELEQEYRLTLQRLEGIVADVYPASARDTIRQCIADGQRLFQQMKDQGV